MKKGGDREFGTKFCRIYLRCMGERCEERFAEQRRLWRARRSFGKRSWARFRFIPMCGSGGITRWPGKGGRFEAGWEREDILEQIWRRWRECEGFWAGAKPRVGRCEGVDRCADQETSWPMCKKGVGLLNPKRGDTFIFTSYGDSPIQSP